jgi:hypothetical protein
MIILFLRKEKGRDILFLRKGKRERYTFSPQEKKYQKELPRGLSLKVRTEYNVPYGYPVAYLAAAESLFCLPPAPHGARLGGGRWEGSCI